MDFIDYIQEQARKNNKIFIIDTCEGKSIEDKETGWLIEDYSGWLIYEAQREKFINDRKYGDVYESFGDEYCFAEWSKDADGHILIEFKKY